MRLLLLLLLSVFSLNAYSLSCDEALAVKQLTGRAAEAVAYVKEVKALGKNISQGDLFQLSKFSDVSSGNNPFDFKLLAQPTEKSGNLGYRVKNLTKFYVHQKILFNAGLPIVFEDKSRLSESSKNNLIDTINDFNKGHFVRQDFRGHGLGIGTGVYPYTSEVDFLIKFSRIEYTAEQVAAIKRHYSHLLKQFLGLDLRSSGLSIAEQSAFQTLSRLGTFKSTEGGTEEHLKISFLRGGLVFPLKFTVGLTADQRTKIHELMLEDVSTGSTNYLLFAYDHVVNGADHPLIRLAKYTRYAEYIRANGLENN